MNIRKLAQLGFFTTISLTIYVIESFLPVLAPIPGIKLGLSNIVTLFLLTVYTKKDSLLVLIARILLASIFTGQMISFFYSLAGGVLCFIAMCIMSFLLKKQYIYITSIIGALFHNFGQILIAIVILQSLSILTYIPLLVISSVITGLFTGLCTHFFIQKFSIHHLI